MPIVAPPFTDSIMVIAAHPDDIESWCAATIARTVDTGATVRLLLVTSGDKGTDDATLDPAQVGYRREAEARAAATILGITDITFLRYADGEVEDTRALRSDMVLWIRRWRPTVLFTHDPEHGVPPYLLHRDHRITGRVALDAVYPLARDPLSFPEQIADGVTAHAVSEVWLFASTVADVYVDISAGFERKLAARLAHASQTSDPKTLRTSWERRAAQIGIPGGLPAAEAFTVLTLE